MASFLFGIGQAILFRDHKKKLKRYHEEATIESILDDLTKILKPKSNQLDSLQTRFSIDGAQDTERYWDEACFARYLKNQHGILIPEPAIPILWRCLHFYAYHPFQHTAPDRLDYKAFQRAIALLAVQGTDLLGTDEYGDAYWHNNREYAEKADFKRIFRSISVPVEEVKYESVDVLNDAMDVLAMVQPRMMPFLPSQSELEPVVRRVLGDGISVRYDLQRKDLVVLVDLMLKLRLYTPRWGDNFHYGTFERSDSGGLADILVDALGDLSELSDTAMELLSNLHRRFHQLWAVILQPSMGSLSRIPHGISGSIPAAISLILPQSPHAHRRRQDTRTLLEDPVKLSDIRLAVPINALNDQQPHILLLTGFDDETPVTVGVLFPGPLWWRDYRGRKRYTLMDSSHVIFQLKPRLRLFKWSGECINLAKSVNAEREVKDIMRGGGIEYTKAYSIGDDGVNLHIDPETRRAIFKVTSTEDSGYKEVGDTAGSTTNIKINQMHIFNVTAGDPAPKHDDQDRWFETEPWLTGDDLTTKITGFGCNTTI
ncbi:hypothetical protein AWENTII_010300 [Aspergillus wentii]|nr:hypothetical protein MW887_009488 [Aspergillus wentii]